MSTKIYTAYRCGIKDFTKVFLPAFRETCFKAAAKRAKELMKHVEDSVIKEVYDKGWQDEMSYEQYQQKLGKLCRFRHVFRTCAEASKQAERDFLFCFDISLNLWLYNNKAYIIPIGEGWIYEKFKIPEEAEEYAYWNSSDKPNEITARQWQARLDTWEKVCLNDHNSARLNHQIINAKEHTGLYEIARLILPERQAAIAELGV